MKGIFIPEITVEMFRNGCLESIETLMTEGEIYDIEYDPKSEEPEQKKGRCPIFFLSDSDVPDTNVGNLVNRQDAIDAVRKEFKRIPTAAIRAMEVIKQLPSAEPELDPCVFCKNKDDCGYMGMYCPAERKEE